MMFETGKHLACAIVNPRSNQHIIRSLQNFDPTVDNFRADVLKPADQLVHHIKEQTVPTRGQPL
jgi:hypothetical protein